MTLVVSAPLRAFTLILRKKYSDQHCIKAMSCKYTQQLNAIKYRLLSTHCIGINRLHNKRFGEMERKNSTF